MRNPQSLKPHAIAKLPLSLCKLGFISLSKILFGFIYYPLLCWPRVNRQNSVFTEEEFFAQEFKGFKEFFNQKIQPLALEIELKRVKNLRKIAFRYRIFWLLIVIIVPLAIHFKVFDAVSSFYNSSSSHHNSTHSLSTQHQAQGLKTCDLVSPLMCLTFSLLGDGSLKFFLAICGLVLVKLFIHRNDDYVYTIKDKIFRLIFESFYGFNYHPEGSGDPLSYCSFKLFSDVEKISSLFSRTSDLIVGNYKNIHFTFEELSLTKIANERSSRSFENQSINFSNSTTATFSIANQSEKIKEIFNGHAIKMNFNKKFKNITLIKSDLGLIKNYLNKPSDSSDNLQKVALEDPEFEKIFEIYSQDQIEARYLLSPAFMERLKSLTEFYGKNSKLQGSFCDNQLLLTFSGFKFDMFEPQSHLKPFDIAKDCKTLLKHINLIFTIIDSLEIDKKIF